MDNIKPDSQSESWTCMLCGVTYPPSIQPIVLDMTNRHKEKIQRLICESCDPSGVIIRFNVPGSPS